MYVNTCVIPGHLSTSSTQTISAPAKAVARFLKPEPLASRHYVLTASPHGIIKRNAKSLSDIDYSPPPPVPSASCSSLPFGQCGQERKRSHHSSPHPKGRRILCLFPAQCHTLVLPRWKI